MGAAPSQCHAELCIFFSKINPYSFATVKKIKE